MKTIVIKTQAEFDALPAKFDSFTVIEVRSEPSIWITIRKSPESSSVVARESSRVEAWGSSSVVARESSRVVARESSSVVAWGSSRVVAWGSSRVVAWGSSSVVAWGSSRVVARESSSVVARESSSVEAHDISFVAILGAAVAIKALYDFSIASFRGVTVKVEFAEGNTRIIEQPRGVEHSFDEMLERGYVEADGICKKLVSRKKVGEVEIFTVRGHIDAEDSFVARQGEKFAHGKTAKEASDDLRYKISDRDPDKFKKWKKTDKKSVDELIEAYRAITGACAFGVKEWMEKTKITVDKMTVAAAIKLTQGAYGADKFAEFFAK